MEEAQSYTIQSLKILLFEEQSLIADNYKNLKLKGDVKVTRKWSNPSNTSFGIFFDLIDSGESMRCAFWTKSKKEVEKFQDYDRKKCIVYCHLDVDKIFQNFQLNVKQIELNDEISKLELLKKQCQEKGLLKNKKSVEWSAVSRIAVISKNNTQGYSDFMNQLQIPIHVDLEEVPLEGPQTATEIIKKIKHFNSSKDVFDCILIIRGGGNTTEIANSFDKIELFEVMKKSEIPIVTAIGHHNDTQENLFITQISDMDFPTPTSLAKSINSIVFDSFYQLVGQKIQATHQKFLTIMNEKQYKILFDLRKEVEEWVQQFSNYHVIDLTNVSPEKEIIFLKNGKYYRQTIVLTDEIPIHKKELDKKNTIMTLLNTNNITSLLSVVEKEKKTNKTIIKLCSEWIHNEKESKDFLKLAPISVNWKELKTSSRTLPKLQKQKQMYSHLQENVLYHTIEMEMFENLQEHFKG